jgi:hypothetical protein
VYDKELALIGFQLFENKWAKKYPNEVSSWESDVSFTPQAGLNLPFRNFVNE